MNGILEHWNGGRLIRRKRGVFLDFSNPVFHYSIIPEGLRCINYHQKFGLLVADITKFVRDA
jgi:hypothetical protein